MMFLEVNILLFTFQITFVHNINIIHCISFFLPPAIIKAYKCKILKNLKQIKLIKV